MRCKPVAVLVLLFLASTAVEAAGIAGLVLGAVALGGVDGRAYPNAALQFLAMSLGLAALAVRLEAEIYRRALALLR